MSSDKATQTTQAFLDKPTSELPEGTSPRHIGEENRSIAVVVDTSAGGQAEGENTRYIDRDIQTEVVYNNSTSGPQLGGDPPHTTNSRRHRSYLETLIGGTGSSKQSNPSSEWIPLVDMATEKKDKLDGNFPHVKCVSTCC